MRGFEARCAWVVRPGGRLTGECRGSVVCMAVRRMQDVSYQTRTSEMEGMVAGERATAQNSVGLLAVFLLACVSNMRSTRQGTDCMWR